jgi:hypothetical protein
MGLLADILQRGLFLAGLAMVILVLLRRSVKYATKPSRNRPHAPPQPEANPKFNHLDAPGEIIRYQVQLHEMARELTARIDSKMLALQHLEREADLRIDRLETLLARLASIGDPPLPGVAPYPIPPRGAEPAPAAAGANATPTQREIYSLADQGLSAATIAHRVHTPLVEVQQILDARMPS